MENKDGLKMVVERVLATKEWYGVSFFRGGRIHVQGRFGSRLFECVEDFEAWVNRPAGGDVNPA